MKFFIARFTTNDFISIITNSFSKNKAIILIQISIWSHACVWLRGSNYACPISSWDIRQIVLNDRKFCWHDLIHLTDNTLRRHNYQMEHALSPPKVPIKMCKIIVNFEYICTNSWKGFIFRSLHCITFCWCIMDHSSISKNSALKYFIFLRMLHFSWRHQYISNNY